MRLPPLGLCLPCRAVEVRDGDTVIVTVLTGARWAIRLIDCWAPELRRGSDEERARGQRAKEYAQQCVDEARKLWVWVPAPEHVETIVEAGGGANLLKAATFDRVPGHVFVGLDTTLSDLMVRSGHATRRKPKPSE